MPAAAIAPTTARQMLNKVPEVTAALSPEQIGANFDLGYHLKHVDTIFARVFG